MTITLNGTNGITTPEVVLDNTAADGGQVVLKSTGYSDWNWDNYNGRLRAYSGGTEYFTVNSSGNVGIGTSSYSGKLVIAGAGLGNWSTNNYGRQLLIYGSGTNPSIGIWDANSDNALAITNNSGAFVISAMPASPTNSTSPPTERMRIDLSGNVGINTGSPSTYGKFGVVSGSTYLGVAPDAFTSVLIGPRQANDGVASILMSYSGVGTYGSNYWKFDSSSTNLATFRNGVLKSYLNSSGEFYVGGATAYSNTADSSVLSLSNISITSNNGFNFVANKPASPSQTAWMTFFVNGGLQGYINYTNPGCSYINASDARLKENIVDAGSALDVVAKLPIRSFDWKDNDCHEDFGFVAQELHAVYPNAAAVGKDKEDGSIEIPWGVDPSKLVAMLAKAIQELKAELDATKTRLTAAEEQILNLGVTK